MEDKKSFAMIDGPGPLDTPEDWERYLDDLRAMPDSVMNKQALIESAERWIAVKKKSRADLAARATETARP
jgi:hypothetical protein